MALAASVLLCPLHIVEGLALGDVVGLAFTVTVTLFEAEQPGAVIVSVNV